MKEFKFKKKYGQNFIKDENLINKIVNSAEISKDSLVIEIGPGMGALTTKILNKCNQAIIYEIDIELKEYLESGDVEELADLEEVLRAILDIKGVSYEEFEKIRDAKVDERGAFKKKIFLESVSEKNDK